LLFAFLSSSFRPSANGPSPFATVVCVVLLLLPLLVVGSAPHAAGATISFSCLSAPEQSPPTITTMKNHPPPIFSAPHPAFLPRHRHSTDVHDHPSLQTLLEWFCEDDANTLSHSAAAECKSRGPVNVENISGTRHEDDVDATAAVTAACACASTSNQI
jgi:hypothetical protein